MAQLTRFAQAEFESPKDLIAEAEAALHDNVRTVDEACECCEYRGRVCWDTGVERTICGHNRTLREVAR